MAAGGSARDSSLFYGKGSLNLSDDLVLPFNSDDLLDRDVATLDDDDYDMGLDLDDIICEMEYEKPLVRPSELLREYWHVFPLGARYSKTLLYDIKDSSLPCDAATDVLLKSAFPLSNDHPMPKTGMIVDWIHDNLNIHVEAVWRIQNYALTKVHDALADAFQISSSMTLFHGTDSSTADILARAGIKTACGKRDKWGAGFYGSTSLVEALLYAKPDIMQNRTVVVMEYLKGPSMVGTPGLQNFGENSNGESILTTTNDSNPPTIHCGSKDAQFLVSHILSFKFDMKNPLTLHHRQMLRSSGGNFQSMPRQPVALPPLQSQPGLGKPFPPQYALARPLPPKHALTGPVVSTHSAVAAVAPIAAVAAVAAPIAARNVTKVQTYKGFSKGDAVTINSCIGAHAFCIGRLGIIEAILVEATVTTRFCIRIPGCTNRELIKIFKGNWHRRRYDGMDQDWLNCTHDQFSLYVAPVAASAPVDTSVASSSMMQASTQGTASATINSSTSGAILKISSNGVGASASGSVVPHHATVREGGGNSDGKRAMQESDDTQEGVAKKRKS